MISPSVRRLGLEREGQQNSFPRQAAQPPPAPQPLPEPIPAPAAPSRTQEELRRMLESMGFPIEEEEQAPPPPLPRARPPGACLCSLYRRLITYVFILTYFPI